MAHHAQASARGDGVELDEGASRPALSLAYALVLLNAGQLEEVEPRLQDAERGLVQLGLTIPGKSSASPAVQGIGMNEQQYQSLPTSIANARAYRAQALGDFASTIIYAQQALALLSTDDDYERGTTAAILGLAYWASGNVEAAHRSFAEGLMVFQKLGGIQITVSASFILANMMMAQGCLRAAVKTCEQSLQLAVQQSGTIWQGTAELHLALSEIRYEQGNLEVASQLLQKGEALREQVSVSGADYLWWLLKGRLTEALSWVRECGLSVDAQPDYLQEYEHLTLVRVLIAQYQRDGSIIKFWWFLPWHRRLKGM